MPKGLIMKALSGYYYVLPEGEKTGNSPVQCRARGVFKKKGITPLVGDQVQFEHTENGEGTVTDILPRRSRLVRPPVANVEYAVLVFSVAEPDLNLQLLDKFLVHIENSGLTPLICLTKMDLLNAGEAGAVKAAVRLYESIGYSVHVTSSKKKEGLETIEEALAGSISVFAGQSGVGKSSLLNAMIQGLNLETSEISHRLGRGRHTTRHVELLPLERGGLIADTPGFSQLDFVELEVKNLGECFKEFRESSGNCKFRGCLHIHEPGCAVLEAVQQGEIAKSRYEHYVQFLQEMKDKKRRY
ncbi:putative ribosome biogenesis GTPase RsgA [Paenibacillus larvae subsp. larvae]|uniref:Small ribosomal subunit biogenesis GTPase RsgA n=2 Tax=Paenibacillus larvae subsp. larvae TaxID=147375 RepID=V9W805_9BACL|nr:ribosome small subunit-dependent GTPase A [Paenibacillus larvae]AHD06059.1 putative ribosome biogenesis GTPase RsgA [Paenibacillus larvae subsp. larvae DSM 25430]AQZ48880.1 ribosome small subunit-dependent GTPase A [Paenibacillus larvae subsp. pulvifaciens]AVF26983.1 putative ribosome biogenesis GTPase RsgA [Paenibacillus larvae subsp. larvae]AVF31730.1 putative ribosome biogenesis GTPase RsgA [Paenibacillus larvae subsp. larvae]AVG12589.1 putative ribosome biogenesis GTPase RsgA [Paenibaci